jgi:hypothetical protein
MEQPPAQRSDGERQAIVDEARRQLEREERAERRRKLLGKIDNVDEALTMLRAKTDEISVERAWLVDELAKLADLDRPAVPAPPPTPPPGRPSTGAAQNAPKRRSRKPS